MENQRKRAKYNIVFSLLGQLTAIICGLIVPRILIGEYGSEAYGATASITQFLAYIALLDGGISGVARAALYKPLAMRDYNKVREILNEIKRFFRIISLIFLAYVVVLACSFKHISGIKCFDWFSTFLLVVVISISTFMQYYLGVSYNILINASQKVYITQIITIVTTVINAALVVFLVFADSSLIVVKLVSSIVFASRPVFMWLYVRRHFDLSDKTGKNEIEYDNLLKQKWIGLAQHIAYVLHSNTDVVVLTLFADLKLVAVYSVYSMLIGSVEKIATAFSSGMEALFGELLAKNEHKELDRVFNKYERMISFVSGILFSVTAVMLIPFVRIYTKEINDVNYIYTLFGVMLVIASYLFCIRLPYHAMVTASGSFRQTRVASYGEAVVNLSLSIILVIKFGLVGVAIGTVAAVSFRLVFYVIYLSKNVMNKSVGKFIRRILINISAIVVAVPGGNMLLSLFDLSGILSWCICAAAVTVFATIVHLLLRVLDNIG